MDHTMNTTPDEPSWRKPAGIFMMIGLITLVAVVIASLSTRIALLPGWAQGAIYMTAGLIWILPLRPLLMWMETGKWRE